MIEHDPLCPDSIPDHFPMTDFNGNSFSCQCDFIAKVREDAASFGRGKDFYDAGKADMLAKCIEVVEKLADYLLDANEQQGALDSLFALRALQQPVGPIEDLTDDEVDAYYKALEENT